MGTQYLIDTNVAIDFMRGKLNPTVDAWLRRVMANQAHTLSVITRIELLSWQAPSPEDYHTVEGFVRACSVIDLEEEIIRETIRLRRLLKGKLPDRVIAATALVHRLTLVTRNTADFRGIAGLSVMDSHTLHDPFGPQVPHGRP